MKPGSLVVYLNLYPTAFGIILREYMKYTPYTRYRWWEVLCGDGKTTIEAEGNLKLI